MNIQRAADILEIDLLNITNEKIIKKQYHKLALLNHPDKNDDKSNSHEKFILINDAYEYLKNISFHDETTEEQYDSPKNMSYSMMVGIFIQTIFKDTQYEAIIEIVKEIVMDCNNLSIKLFEGLDKYVCIELYDFILKYKSILHIAPSIIDNIKDIILSKFKDDQIYILNPSLDDLFDGNVYKLIIQDKIYYVPLWHNEMYFDGVGGCEIIVKCVPELPENIQIGDDNNILVYLKVPLNNELLTKTYLSVQIGKREIQLQLNDVYIKKNQIFTFKRQGIYQTQEDDSYNTNKISDIIIYCELV